MAPTPRTVLTTGANSGLGLESTIEFAKRGHRSIGTVRSKAKAKIVAEAASEAGVEVETLLLDVTDADGCRKVIEAFEPDVLVNNAGYMLYGAVEEIEEVDATALLDTMVVAPMRLARLCIPSMRAQGWGRIIQISSLSARISFPLMGWYQGAKQGLEGVSDALRLEVAGDGIAVVLIEPGVFRSELSSEFAAPQGAESSRYADAYAQTAKTFGQMEPFLTDARTVAKTVVRAAEARAPRARYPVGLDAQLGVLSAPFTPAIVRDLVLRRSSRL